MELTLQEIAAAAIRDIDNRQRKRMRQTRTLAGGSAPGRNKNIRINLPVPAYGAERVRPLRRTRVPDEVAWLSRRALVRISAGVLLAALFIGGWAWTRESAGWRDEARAGRRETILHQGRVLHAQIETLALQAARLEEKALIHVQHASDLNHSLPGYAGAPEMDRALGRIADSDRLHGEIKLLRERLTRLREELTVINSP